MDIVNQSLTVVPNDAIVATDDASSLAGADVTGDYVGFLTQTALREALPTAYHDKRALSPTLRDQLTRQIEAEQAGAALVVAPAAVPEAE